MRNLVENNYVVNFFKYLPFKFIYVAVSFCLFAIEKLRMIMSAVSMDYFLISVIQTTGIVI